MLPLFALLNGCDDTDTIIFDDELPQFEIKANAILLEVIMPKGVSVKTSSIGLAYSKYTCRRCASVREISACWQRRLYGTSQHNCRVPLMRLLPNFSVHWNNNPGKGISASCVM